MQDTNKRLLWAVLSIVLPGPWTPFIVLAYLLARTAEDQHDSGHSHRVVPHYPPDPYACVPAPASPAWNPYAPPQLSGGR